MIKIRSIIVFAVIPLLAGYGVASLKNNPTGKKITIEPATMNTSAILPTDIITVIDQGNIISVTHTTQTQVTKNQTLIEPVPIPNGYLAINKQTNYADLLSFTMQGNKTTTVLNGNTGNIDTMIWVSDPAISPDRKIIAFVSDKDSAKTNISDNALYLGNFTTRTTQLLTAPNPHSGGITHPEWNPVDPNMITYDYYQYDSQTLEPYSTIIAKNIASDVTQVLTTEKEHAFQGSFSSNGKQFVYLGRNSDTTVSLYLADVTSDGLINKRTLAIGQFAYPHFSYTQNHLYFFQAKNNQGFNLMEATITNNALKNIMAITNTATLQANSNFSVTKNIKK